MRAGDAVSSLEPSRVVLAEGGRGGRDALMVGALWALARPEVYGIPARLPFLHLGETVYREPRSVLSGISRAAAAGALDSLGLADAELKLRHQRAAQMMDRLAGHPILKAIRPPGSAHRGGFLRLPVLIVGEASDRLARSGRPRGVAQGYPRVLPALASEVGLEAHRDQSEYPGAARLAAHLLTLPTHRFSPSFSASQLEGWLSSA